MKNILALVCTFGMVFYATAQDTITVALNVFQQPKLQTFIDDIKSLTNVDAAAYAEIYWKVGKIKTLNDSIARTQSIFAGYVDSLRKSESDPDTESSDSLNLRTDKQTRMEEQIQALSRRVQELSDNLKIL